MCNNSRIPSRVTVTRVTESQLYSETEKINHVRRRTQGQGCHSNVYRSPQTTTGHPVRPLGVFYLNFTNLFRFQHAQNHPAGCYCKKCPRFPKRGANVPLDIQILMSPLHLRGVISHIFQLLKPKCSNSASRREVTPCHPSKFELQFEIDRRFCSAARGGAAAEGGGACRGHNHRLRSLWEAPRSF